MGLFSDVAGIFGSVQEKRAAEEASRILNEAKQQAMNASADLSAQFKPFTTAAGDTLSTVSGLLKQYLSQAEGVQVETGMTAADQLAYQQASKLFNEQMASTGNLRSGAAAYGQSQLLRGVVADAQSRTFNEQMAKLSTLFGGAQVLGGIGQTQGAIGLQGQQLATGLLQTAFGMAPAIAGAELQKGAANANVIGTIGGLTDSLVSTAAGAMLGGMGALPGLAGGGLMSQGAGIGALLGSGGGGNLMNYMMLSKLFSGAPAK